MLAFLFPLWFLIYICREKLSMHFFLVLRKGLVTKDRQPSKIVRVFKKKQGFVFISKLKRSRLSNQ